MKVLSLNVGMPRDAVWRGEALRTGIFKQPVAGRVQADAAGGVTGGVDREQAPEYRQDFAIDERPGLPKVGRHGREEPSPRWLAGDVRQIT